MQEVLDFSRASSVIYIEEPLNSGVFDRHYE